MDYTINEDAGTVQLSVSVHNGIIPEAGTIIVTLNTSDGTAECMLVHVYTLYKVSGPLS